MKPVFLLMLMLRSCKSCKSDQFESPKRTVHTHFFLDLQVFSPGRDFAAGDFTRFELSSYASEDGFDANIVQVT
jgi:hypothetical protein